MHFDVIGTKSDREHFHRHAIPPGRQEVTELVDDHEKGDDECECENGGHCGSLPCISEQERGHEREMRARVIRGRPRSKTP